MYRNQRTNVFLFGRRGTDYTFFYVFREIRPLRVALGGYPPMSSRTVARLAATRGDPPLSLVGGQTLGGVTPPKPTRLVFVNFFT